jgi:O-antigen ligase
MLFLVLYYDCLRKGHMTVRSWLLTFAVVGVYLLTKSLTAVGAGVLMLCLLLIMGYWKSLPKIRGARWIICGMAIFLILICGFQAQNLLASLLDKTSKGVTLNSRTYIWDFALNLIRERPIFGHGTFTDQELFTDYVLYGVNHAHNLLLELLLRTGVVGSLGYLTFLFGFAPIGKSHRVPKAHGILVVGLAGQLLLSFMDFYPTILPFYIFMGVLYCSHRFCPPPEATEDTPSEVTS